MVSACVKKPILDVDEPHETTHFIILVFYETVVWPRWQSEAQWYVGYVIALCVCADPGSNLPWLLMRSQQ